MSRVAVLKGGRSLERQVSLRSGARVHDSLERLGHEAVGVDVGHDLVDRLREARPDAAFVALHGRDGEDGTVQELLEVLGIPYTGSGISACIRCWDKVLAKHEMRAAGIPTPDFYAFGETAFKELGAAAVLPAIEERLRFPIVVKPSAQGSALGISFARTAADVATALVAAFSYDTKVLLERHVSGRDLAVSLVEDTSGPRLLPIVEARPKEATDGPAAHPPEEGALPGGPHYSFEARYEIGATEFECPARLPQDTTARVQALALEVWRLFGCAGFARVDLMLEQETGEPFVLEVNPIPGFTETSLLPQAAEADGVSFDQLIEAILARATA
ncbi:MAG: D-alanine--D-alanine ligase family protein [Solirubrobacteraceae bacterium]